MRISKLLSSFANRVLFKNLNKENAIYIVGKYKLDVPLNYGNINFQEEFRLYDRFLPILVKNINSNQTIIDVGANIGDTTIALLQKCSNPFVTVEPSDLFHPYLIKNLNKLPQKDFDRVQVVKALIGTGDIKGELSHEVWGTATLTLDDNIGEKTHTTIDDIINKKSEVVLLKVDTDGYDFDVIKSAEETLSKSEPILFWENEIFEDFQMKGFDELYFMLEQRDYKYIFIFDNFGNIISEETDFKTLKNINIYIYNMLKNNCTRTIYYTDILACTSKNILNVRNAIEEYTNSWIHQE